MTSSHSTHTQPPLLSPYPRIFFVVLVFAQLLGCAAQLNHSNNFVAGSGGTAIAYDVVGSGEVGLIFVHGWSCDRSYWREQISTFSKDYRVVTLDLGGHGDSSTDRDDWSIQSFGTDVAAVALAIDVEHVVLIGHSMGGPVALEAAKQMGDRVVGVIGVDTLRNAMAEPASLQAALRAFDTPAAEFPERTAAFVRGSFFIKASPAELVDQIAVDMSEGDPEVAAASGASLLTYNVREAVQLLSDIPLTLINADYRSTDAAALKAAHPDGRVSVIRNAGHFVMLEQSRAFNAALSAELKRMVPRELSAE